MQSIPRTLRRLASRYSAFSEANPHTTASLTAGTILTVSDVTAQRITHDSDEHHHEWDPRRTLALATFGFLYYGGPCKYIYLCYDKFIGPGRVILTTFIDCFLHTPFVVVPCFYLTTGTIKGHSLVETATALQRDWVTASFGSVLVWTPAQLICFRWIPQHSRIVWVACISFLHKTWLSWLSNKERASEKLRKRSEQALLTKNKENI